MDKQALINSVANIVADQINNSQDTGMLALLLDYVPKNVLARVHDENENETN